MADPKTRRVRKAPEAENGLYVKITGKELASWGHHVETLQEEVNNLVKALEKAVGLQESTEASLIVCQGTLAVTQAQIAVVRAELERKISEAGLAQTRLTKVLAALTVLLTLVVTAIIIWLELHGLPIPRP